MLRRLPSSGLQSATDGVPQPSAHVPAAKPATGRTVAVQVLMARGLPPADLNGLADPYCSVLCGSEEGLTAPIFNSLAPRWNETFVFANPQAANEAFPQRQCISITVKDSNKHLPDDYLGKVHHKLDINPGGDLLQVQGCCDAEYFCWRAARRQKRVSSLFQKVPCNVPCL